MNVGCMKNEYRKNKKVVQKKERRCAYNDKFIISSRSSQINLDV
jgi:hypothetical protein